MEKLLQKCSVTCLIISNGTDVVLYVKDMIEDPTQEFVDTFLPDNITTYVQTMVTNNDTLYYCNIYVLLLPTVVGYTTIIDNLLWCAFRIKPINKVVQI